MKPLRRDLRAVGGIALALLCGGCVSWSGEFGTRIPHDALLEIRDGSTTREEITSWFGPPSAFYNPTVLDMILGNDEVSETQSPVLNDVFAYRYVENETTLFFVPILFARLVAVSTAETLVVFFDEDGRVAYHAYRRDEH